MSLLRHIGTNSACTHAYIPVYPQSGLPNWPFHGQFMANLKKFGDF